MQPVHLPFFCARIPTATAQQSLIQPFPFLVFVRRETRLNPAPARQAEWYDLEVAALPSF
jgi:hypothetical protein